MPSCEVRTVSVGGNFAFVPAIAVVDTRVLDDGGRMRWTSMDGNFHTATADFCFHVDIGAEATVDFLIEDGRLFASSNGGAYKLCNSAVSLPDGSFLVAYRCAPHPNMIARLLVH